MPRKNKSSTKKVTIVDQWLNSKKVSAKDKSLIKKMSPAEIKVNFDNSLMTFGTAGIRAKMGPGTKQFNEFTYTQAAYGYAKYISKKFKNPSVVIGHDNRLNSGKYSLLCAKVLSSFGIKVYLFKKNELMPTPIISFAIRQLNASGGIIITVVIIQRNTMALKHTIQTVHRSYHTQLMKSLSACLNQEIY